MRSNEVYALLREAWGPILRAAGFRRTVGLSGWAQDHGGHFLLISPQVFHHGWDSVNGSCFTVEMDVAPKRKWQGGWGERFGRSLPPEVVADVVAQQQQIARRIDERAARAARDSGQPSGRVNMCEATGDDFRYSMALAYYDEDDVRAWLPLLTPLLLPETYKFHDRRCDAGPSKQERRSARSPGEIQRIQDFWESCRSCDRRASPRGSRPQRWWMIAVSRDLQRGGI